MIGTGFAHHIGPCQPTQRRSPIPKPRAKRQIEAEDVVRLLRWEVERMGSQSAFAKAAGVDRATTAGQPDRDAVVAAAAKMKEIVVVCLAIDAETGEIDPTAPFVVIPHRRRLQPHRGGVYRDKPNVIDQFHRGERQARFEAEWTADGWKFGKRVTDA
jgi:hypothetical protein